MSEPLNEKLAALLPKEVQEVVAEAFAEERAAIRAELARQYEHDKAVLIKSVDEMTNDTLRHEITELHKERAALREDRKRLQETITSNKNESREKAHRRVAVLEAFVQRTLAKELHELTADRTAIKNQRVRLAKAIAEAKETTIDENKKNQALLREFIVQNLSNELKEFAAEKKALIAEQQDSKISLEQHTRKVTDEANTRIKTLEGFVLKQMKNEMADFNKDRQALVEARVELMRDGKKKLEETRKAFVKRSAKLVESNVTDMLREEMSTFRKDIENSRMNFFGRRIFESFVQEFLTTKPGQRSHLGKVIKKLDEANVKLAESEKRNEQSQRLIQESERKAQIADERALRVQTLNSLLTPLNREKREIMEGLLKDVKTKELKESFNKFLPMVINESVSAPRSAGRNNQTLNEAGRSGTLAMNKPVEVTGDRKSFKLNENSETPPSEFQAVIDDMLIRAGVKE